MENAIQKGRIILTVVILIIVTIIGLPFFISGLIITLIARAVRLGMRSYEDLADWVTD